MIEGTTTNQNTEICYHLILHCFQISKKTNSIAKHFSSYIPVKFLWPSPCQSKYLNCKKYRRTLLNAISSLFLIINKKPVSQDSEKLNFQILVILM